MFNKIIFGGDSAGSQIAGQFLSIQTNSKYAKSMGMKKVIPEDNISGFISYCGPVDLEEIKQQSSDEWVMKFFVNTVAWSLLGTKDWKDSSELKQASLVDKLTNDFPPTYISDGNSYSFQDQGITFANRLKELSVPVKSLFYKDVEKTITHDYQFDYTTSEAKKLFR
ncbi:alpha/beta hydrolase fold domain-containing protein [Enterococcus wangshanyuanii]|uniref:alpha/beta hydrolase fold domain-containing protein n=1 Tax=Enterococcus wangshanyuanii TaxID=2005703 RepID=UPI003AAF028F